MIKTLSVSRLVVVIALAALVAPLSAQQSPTAPADDDALYVIGAKDVLAISVYGQPDLSGKFTVEGDGTIPYSLIGRLRAAGLTVRTFENALRKQLADNYLRNPQVSISVDLYASQKISVMGEVRAPGSYPLTGGRTALIDILAKAGATTAGEVVLVRSKDPSRPAAPDDENAEVVRIDLRGLQSGVTGDNISLRDGDTIIVPKADSAYVYGEVNTPGAYGITRETTVLQALALAGGTKDTAAMNRVRIVRIVDGKEIELKGVRPSERILPGDTVIVPQRFF
jgi:polysaccharide export outer membrane protein